MSKEILIFGHKNPDTDSICSAIAFSELKNKTGENTIPIRLGEISKETEFVLNYFNVEAPKLQTNVSGEEVILVDHNERTQTADGIEEAKILELVDHHRISNFHTDEPLKVRMEPVGCTSTILYGLYKEASIIPEKKVAGLMLSAIVSDTLLFKSPTCTEIDIKAAKELADIAEVNLEKYGLEMLIAGTNLDDKTEEELLNMDMKIASYFIRGNFLYIQVNFKLAYFYTQNRKEEQKLERKSNRHRHAERRCRQNNDLCQLRHRACTGGKKGFNRG